MADLRRIVQRPSSGTVVVKNLDDQAFYVMVRDSFKVTAPVRHGIDATRQRRYGGSRVVGETHDNGSIGWTALVRGASVDAALANVESLLTVLESPQTDLFFEWKPEGATSSVFYEIRGPATWNPLYKWVEMSGAQFMQVEVTIPVAPLAQLDRVTQTITSRTWPAQAQIPSAITGDAPALVDVAVTVGAGNASYWALIGWAPRPSTPLSGTVAPLGVLQAESATNVSGFGTIIGAGTPDSSYLGGQGRTSGSISTGQIAWAIDPSTLVADDFSQGEVDLEVFARIKVPAGAANPRAILYAQPADASSVRYSAEFGVRGTALRRDTASSHLRHYRLGVITLPVNRDAPASWKLGIVVQCDAAVSGWGLDYAFIARARARAVCPTRVSLVDTPPFIATGAAATKKIRGADLSGTLATSGGVPTQSSGLGGSPIEIEPGLTDLLMDLSSGIPDGDPADDSADDSVTRTASVDLTITPRVWLAKGA